MIRLAALADASAVYGLLSGELGYRDLARAAFEDAFAKVLAHAEMKVWLAIEEGAIVGMISLSHRPQARLGGTLATIDELVIHSSQRGKGIGGELLEAAKEESMRLGAVRLELETSRARDAYTREFYPKHGFTEVDRAVMRIELR